MKVKEGIAVMARERPDVVLMDLRMPQLDGVAAINRITVDQPEVRVLVLTTYDEDHDIVRAIEAGARGVLLKDAPARTSFGPSGPRPTARWCWPDQPGHRPRAGALRDDRKDPPRARLQQAGGRRPYAAVTVAYERGLIRLPAASPHDRPGPGQLVMSLRRKCQKAKPTSRMA